MRSGRKTDDQEVDETQNHRKGRELEGRELKDTEDVIEKFREKYFVDCRSENSLEVVEIRRLKGIFFKFSRIIDNNGRM